MGYTPSHNFNSVAVNEVMSLGIKDENVINAIAHTERATFVPINLKSFANNDYYLKYSQDRFLQARHTLAVMISSIKYSSNSKVAVIGAGTGYLPTVFSKIFKNVCAVESNKIYEAELTKNTKNVKNISIAKNLNESFNECDFIFIENDLGYSAKELKLKLSEEGKLLYIKQEKGVNFIFLEDKKGNTTKIQQLIAYPDIKKQPSEDFIF